ncbi:MAG: (d)CMP kinase [Caldilineaceae bacterium]|nr:(d)CMP kinase [Caldilineaceae bacterium]
MNGSTESPVRLRKIAPKTLTEAQQWGLWLSPRVIAIDGPAGSGKSTVGYGVAQALDFLYFDTGAMYRAVTWAALERQLDLHDGDAVGKLAEELEMDILPPGDVSQYGRNSKVLVDGKEVTADIRRPEVDQRVSVVSAHARVRDALSRQQKRIGARYGSGEDEKPGIVMVGRDIGTVIMPDAALKIFLDASAEERARRRHRELLGKGKEIAYVHVLADILQRDQIDSRRTISPLRAADDAVVIDTSNMGVEKVVASILALVVQVAQGGGAYAPEE